ncbi:MAG: hypothetical protein QM784_31760 [Polyangiaceae bacterium]
MSTSSRWTFFRAGGFDQVKLESGADLMNLESLDQKLWVALACPTSGLEIDKRTLELIDTDKDGRVRAPELIAALKFAGRLLENPDDLLAGRGQLPLASIRSDSPEGETLHEAALQILRNLGKSDATSLSVEELENPISVFANAPFNGDGIITEQSADVESDKAVVRLIVDHIGSVLDRSGERGVSSEHIREFFEELRAFADWQERAAAEPKVLPLGRERTETAFAAVERVRAKVDDFFTRCRLAEFDPRISAALNRKEDEYAEVIGRDMSLTAEEVAGFPLAHVAAGRALPLEGALNPAHATAIESLRKDVVLPLLGDRRELSEAEWRGILETLAPFAQWQQSKLGRKVETLGTDKVNELLWSGAETRLKELVEKDQSREDELKCIEDVERLVRYYRDLYRITTNFVNFRDFYYGKEASIFQCGTLYLDQRACRLCIRVQDPATHAKMAGLAGAYLAYVECRRPADDEKFNVVAVVTAGDSDNLMVGRNGLFYDRNGRDYDATITKIVDCPISIRQAFWSPYKKFVRLIEQQVAKRAATAEGETQTSLATTAATTANLDKEPAVAGAKRVDVGSVAALGVAVGAIGTFFTAMVGYVTGVLRLGILATIGAGIGMILLISMPSVVLAYITLRKRNLGPILDASGWAVNANAKINVAFGASLTSVAKLPAGARRDAFERFADEGLPWKRLIFVGLLLVLLYRWADGSLDRFVPDHLRARTLIGKMLPSRPH